MKKLIYLLLVITGGCELVINVEQPPFQPSIVLGSFIGPDTTIMVNLSEDRYVLERPDEFDPITGATVQLFEGNQLVGVLEEITTGQDSQFPIQNGGRYGLDFRPSPGVEYRLEVEKEGFKSVQATEQLPANSPRFEVLNIDQGQFSDTEIEIKIFDETGRDYYEISAYLSVNTFSGHYDDVTQEFQVDSIWRSTNMLSMYTENIAVEQHNSSIFSDRLFDGRSYELDMETYLNVWVNPDVDVDPDPVLTIEVRRVSEAYFNYINSSALQWWVDGDPFAEPVQAFSNVENGRGVFGSYVSSRQEFPIELDQ